MSEEIDAARDARVRIMVFGRLPARTAARLAEAGVRITPSAETAWAAPGAAVGPTDPADLIRGADGAPHLLVLQPPVGRAEYTAALRAARATGAELRIVDPVRGRDSVEDFVMAARTLNDREGIGVVRVRCMAEEIYTAFHIITDAFGRPRRLSRAESGVLEGTAGGTRFALRVGGGALRLAAASSAGELVLVSEDGPLLWCADEYGPEAVTPVTGRASALADDRRRALLRELTVRGSPADSRSRSQQEILLSGVLEDARELCPAGTWEAGRSRPPSAGRVHAADLLARPSDDVPLRLPFSDLARSAAEAAGAAAVDPRRIGRLREATAVADSYSRAAMARLLRPVLPARSAAEVIDRLGASRRHAWLVRRWLAALIRSRVLEDGEGVLSPGAAPDDPGERSLAEAYNLLGFNPLMTRLHTEIAGRLGELIRDETRIEEILFAHHDIVPALTAYQDNVVSRYLNAGSWSGEPAAASARGPGSAPWTGGGSGRAVRTTFSPTSPRRSSRPPGIGCRGRDCVSVCWTSTPTWWIRGRASSRGERTWSWRPTSFTTRSTWAGPFGASVVSCARAASWPSWNRLVTPTPCSLRWPSCCRPPTARGAPTRCSSTVAPGGANWSARASRSSSTCPIPTARWMRAGSTSF